MSLVQFNPVGWFFKVQLFQEILKRPAWLALTLFLTSCENSVSTPALSDVSLDALPAPQQPDLTLSAEPGVIKLQWTSPIPSSLARVYQTHLANNEESLLVELTGNQTSWSVKSQSHLRAWHQEYFRVELCDEANQCVSSNWQSIKDLVADTVQLLHPPVFTANDVFAQTIAINNSATLMATTLSSTNAIQLFTRAEGLWSASQSLALNTGASDLISPWQIHFSEIGDTLAVLENTRLSHNLIVFQRLGESWIETFKWSLPLQHNTTAPDSDYPVAHMIIADDGDQILVALNDRVHQLKLTADNWSDTEVVFSNGQTLDCLPDAYARINTTLSPIAASGDFERVYTLGCRNQQLTIFSWYTKPHESSNTAWQLQGTIPLEQIDSLLEVGLQSNTTGDELTVAGWEPVKTFNEQSPVVWHYTVTDFPTEVTGENFAYDIITSIRFKPTDPSNARLRFDTDDALRTLTLGWQNDNLSHAEFVSYVFSPPGLWQAALEAPEAISTLAKQNFLQAIKLSGDGSLFAISLEEKVPLSDNLPINQLISFF